MLKGTKISGGQHISIGDDVLIGSRTVLYTYQAGSIDNSIKLYISNGVHIGDDCHITAANFITIGLNCLLGKKITITDH